MIASSRFNPGRTVLPLSLSSTSRFERACQFEAAGLKSMDALHLACAEAADCDWFFTTDAGILKKARGIAGIRVANPVEFVGEV